MVDFEYLKQKRLDVLNAIKPICDAYGIKNYDYVVSETAPREILIVEGVEIGCSLNSVQAVVQELTGYIFLMVWRGRSLGAFATQTRNVIERYWIRKES